MFSAHHTHIHTRDGLSPPLVPSFSAPFPPFFALLTPFSKRATRQGKQSAWPLVRGLFSDPLENPKKSAQVERVVLARVLPCPWSDLEGCLGVVTATWRLHSDHVYLRCSNNDPQRHQNVSGAQCKWSFNWVRDVDPEYAASLLSRRDLEKRSEEGK